MELRKTLTSYLQFRRMNPAKLISKPRKLLDKLLWILPLASFFVVWETVVRMGLLSAHAAPPPSKVVIVLVHCLGDFTFLSKVLHSFLNLTIGIFIALFIAAPLAICTGLKNRVDITLTPTVMICGSLPDLAILPLFVYWFGPGSVAAILMAAICAFFPIYFTIREGVKEIPAEYFHVSMVFKASKFDVLSKIVLPATFPNAVTGLRLAFDFVWEIVLAIEIIARVAGIGWLINFSVESGSIELAFAGIMAIGIMALTVDRLVFGTLEEKVRRWT
ncbi:ABC transporter permease [Candidatus Bathyarchaeota archaeon]|nr:ABC transporter permease [Candidatus Bathyarchaeota archaeon]